MATIRTLVLSTAIAVVAASTPAAAEPTSPDRAPAGHAVRSDLVAQGEAALSVLPAFVATKSRAEVKAETWMAMHFGLIPIGEDPVRVSTPTVDELIRLAGLHARTSAPASR